MVFVRVLDHPVRQAMRDLLLGQSDGLALVVGLEMVCSVRLLLGQTVVERYEALA